MTGIGLARTLPGVTVFKLLWQVHKWTGIVIGGLLMLSTVTGLFLVLKRDYDWIQPPTQAGTAGAVHELRPFAEVYAAVFGLGLAEFQSEQDINRIDFRPADRVFKVRSEHADCEVQVDAVSLEILSVATRRSDWLERLHDGRWLGEVFHGWVMPAMSLAVALLIATGYTIWLWPKWSRRQRRRRAHVEAEPPGQRPTSAG